MFCKPRMELLHCADFHILRFVGSTGLYWILDAWMDVLSVHSVGEYDDNSFRDTERTIVMQYSSRSILHLCRITN